MKQNTISCTQLCLPHIKHFGYRRISETKIGWVPGIFPELVEILNHHGFIYLLRLIFCDSPKRGWSRSRTVPGKFLIGGLCVCTGGLDILKIAKISTDLLCFIFQFGGLGALREGLSPPKYPVATRLPRRTLTYSCRLPMKVCQALNFTGTSMRNNQKPVCHAIVTKSFLILISWKLILFTFWGAHILFYDTAISVTIAHFHAQKHVEVLSSLMHRLALQFCLNATATFYLCNLVTQKIHIFLLNKVF